MADEPKQPNEMNPQAKPTDATKEQNEKITVAKITAIQAVVLAIIALVGTGISGVTGYMIAKDKVQQPSPVSVVPPNPNQTTVPELNPEDVDGFQTLRDISIFDLRGWKQVSPTETNPRVSPANYINYLHVIKTRNVKTYRAHYATSGTAIDLRCITHESKVLLKEKPTEHEGQKVKEYEIDINIEDLPLNKEFLIVVEATYWNSFQNLVEETASTYTDKDIAKLDELSLFVLLPESKPLKSYKLWAQSTDAPERSEYRGESRIYVDRENRFLYWSITDRKPDHHYQASWTW